MLNLVNTETTLFFVFAGIVVLSTIGTIAAKGAVSSVLFLVLNFIAVAVLYLMLSAPFIAVIQVIVYAGAIMALFLFTVMLLNVQSLSKRNASWRIGFLMLIVTCLFVGIAIMVIGSSQILPVSPDLESFGSIKSLAEMLFSVYLYPFEAVSITLLLAMVGAIFITKRLSSKPS